MKKTLAGVIGILGLLTASSHAGTINLNDLYNAGSPFNSADYMWLEVVECNTNDVNFFQDPQVLGDTLSVNPINFRAQSQNAITTEESTLSMVIMSSSGRAIPALHFAESGDFETLGFSAADASVEATIAYTWNVLAGATGGGAGSTSFLATAGPGQTGKWELDFEILLPAGATKVELAIDNRLTASSSAFGNAFISKKLIDGVSVVVPEPSETCVGLLLLGLLIRPRRGRAAA